MFLFIRSGLFLSIIGLMFFSGCMNPDDAMLDITPPDIDMVFPLPRTDQAAGGFINFEASFTDDLELGSYSIDIHDNIDGHGHGRIAHPATDPSLIRWSFKRNYTIPPGLILFVAQHDDDIEISAKAVAGPYHFIVQAVDLAGNATSYQDGSTREVEIYITNDSQPVVNITNLVNGELELAQGIQFVAEGWITDPTSGPYAGIHLLEVILGEDHGDDGQHDHARFAQDEHGDLIHADYEGPELLTFTTDGAIQLDKIFQQINFHPGQEQMDDLLADGLDHLLLTLKVKDEQGNLTLDHTPVHLNFD